MMFKRIQRWFRRKAGKSRVYEGPFYLQLHDANGPIGEPAEVKGGVDATVSGAVFVNKEPIEFPAFGTGAMPASALPPVEFGSLRIGRPRKSKWKKK